MPAYNRETKPMFFYKVNKQGKFQRTINKESKAPDGSVKPAEIELVDGIRGRLIKIEPFVQEYEGQKTQAMKLVFDDDLNKITLTTGRFSTFGKGIISRLSSANNFFDIAIEISANKPKANEKQLYFANVYSASELLPHSFKKGDYPDVEDVEIQGENFKVYAKQYAFFDEKLAQIIEKIKNQVLTGEINEVPEDEVFDEAEEEHAAIEAEALN